MHWPHCFSILFLQITMLLMLHKNSDIVCPSSARFVRLSCVRSPVRPSVRQRSSINIILIASIHKLSSFCKSRYTHSGPSVINSFIFSICMIINTIYQDHSISSFPSYSEFFFSWDEDTEISDDAPLFNIYPRDVRQHFYCRDGITQLGFFQDLYTCISWIIKGGFPVLNHLINIVWFGHCWYM